MTDEDEEIRALARTHGLAAIECLATLMQRAGSESVRMNAAEKLLERGFGRVAASAAGQDAGFTEQVIRWANSASEATRDPSAKP